MSKPKILVQLDSDPQSSVFDSVVAVDSGVDQLLRHSAVGLEEVQGLVHGAMFTRGPKDLHSTAIFVGGSKVDVGEQLLEAVVSCFFGPMRVSVMLDANGANTTAAAAVLAAARHVDLSTSRALVLGGTGPVGQRVARLLARQGCAATIGSRDAQRAQAACDRLKQSIPAADIVGISTTDAEAMDQALGLSQVVIAAGAAGVELLTATQRTSHPSLNVVIDLNAVPPGGIGGVEVTDRAVERDGQICYGAIGVGATKMKIHKASIARLFEANDQVLDAEEIFAIGLGLE